MFSMLKTFCFSYAQNKLPEHDPSNGKMRGSEGLGGAPSSGPPQLKIGKTCASGKGECWVTFFIAVLAHAAGSRGVQNQESKLIGFVVPP